MVLVGAELMENPETTIIKAIDVGKSIDVSYLLYNKGCLKFISSVATIILKVCETQQWFSIRIVAIPTVDVNSPKFISFVNRNQMVKRDQQLPSSKWNDFFFFFWGEVRLRSSSLFLSCSNINSSFFVFLSNVWVNMQES